MLGPELFNLPVRLGGRGRCLPSRFANDTKIGGLANTTQCCAVLWKDLDRLKSWAEKNNLKFYKGKHRILHLRRSNPPYQYRPGPDLMGSSSTEKDLGALVDSLNQQCALGPRRPTESWSTLGELILPIYWTLVRRQSGRLCPVLGSSAQQRHEASRVSAGKSNRHDQGTGPLLSWGKAERVTPFQPQEEVAEQGPHRGLSVPEGKVSG